MVGVDRSSSSIVCEMILVTERARNSYASHEDTTVVRPSDAEWWPTEPTAAVLSSATLENLANAVAAPSP